MKLAEDRALAELERRTRERKLFLEYGKPYDHDKPWGHPNIGAYHWQIDFHNAGAENPERMLMAANRVGKTRSAGAEMACHLTGFYPKWWKGRKWDRATRGWCGSESSEASRDLVQFELLGKEGEHGTGWIPKESLIEVKYRQAGVTEVVDTIKVKHKAGGVSMCSMKTYEQGRKKWQGAKLDWVWLDEEPPMDIYTEALTRTADSKGMIVLTFTPLLGPDDVVLHFINAEAGRGIYSTNVGWDDAPHLDPDEKERLKLSFPPHERETRVSGTPMLGSGGVFPIADDAISIPPFEIPPHFARINGVDFGIDHPAAGAFLAHDRDADTIYVYDCYRAPGETPVYHAQAMRKHGDWIPTAWPHDGLNRDKGSGVALKDQYRSHGLRMLKEHAHYPDERGNHREPGVIEIFEYMRTGKFKVFNTLTQWFEEKRLYHRKDGVIVAQRDDIMSAMRYAFMMRRYGIVRPPAKPKRKGPRKPIVGGQSWKRAS